MKYLNTLDYGVIGAYCCVLLILGLYLWRKASRSMEDYFLAGRNLPWWALGISGMTNFLDMTGTMIIVSFLYMLGPRGLFVEFRGGAVLILPFLMLWAGKWHYRSKCMTGAEWQIYRFGTGPGAQAARIITAVSTIVLMVGMIAYLIKGAGIFLSMFLPFTPNTSALIMIGLTTVYTIMSGFYGVVYNDLFQSGIILISVVLISVMAACQAFGYQGDLGALAHQVTGNAAWLSSFPPRFTSMPKGYEEFQWLQYVAFFYLLRNIIGGMGMGYDQRYFGARNERECGLLTFFWTWLMMFRWPMMMGFAVLGLFLINSNFSDSNATSRAAELVKNDPVVVARYAEPVGDGSELQIPKNRWEEVLWEIAWHPETYPQLTSGLADPGLLGEDWQRKVQLTSYEGPVNAERILPAVILMRIPAGLRGLFIASLLAAAMSTLSPQVNMATSFFTKDIYQAYLRPAARNRELLLASYVFGILSVAAAFAMATKTKNINDVWDWIIMGLNAGLAVPLLLRLYWWRFNGAGVFWGTLVGMSAAVAQRYYFSVMHPELPDWSPVRKFTVLTLVALAGAVIGTYTSPPTERKVLEHFFRTTRPFGLWRPLRAILPANILASMDRENHRDIAAVPFALAWQVTLFMLPMQLVIGAWRAFAITLAVFLVGLVGVLLLWYRHIPSAQQGEYEATLLVQKLDAEGAPATNAQAIS